MSAMKLLTVKSRWRLSLPDDSHALRRKMEVIRWPSSQSCRDESVLFSVDSQLLSRLFLGGAADIEATASHSGTHSNVGGLF